MTSRLDIMSKQTCLGRKRVGFKLSEHFPAISRFYFGTLLSEQH